MTKSLRVVAFIPLKMNNERLPGKNQKLLGGEVPLYHLITMTLLDIPTIDEVCGSCSEPGLRDLPERASCLRRPEHLDLDSTSIIEVMKSFSTDVSSVGYLLAHATSPFLSSQSCTKIKESVTREGYDSSLSVSKLQVFIWKNGRTYNYDPSSVPRTQDLDLFLSETTGAYACTRKVLSTGRRIGDHPATVAVPKLEAIDVNDEEDWLIANAVYSTLWNSKRNCLMVSERRAEE